jgi:hypothetical protein
VSYGRLPKGWAELAAAAPLMPNVFYSVNGTYFFRLGENAKVEVLDREAFFKTKANR